MNLNVPLIRQPKNSKECGIAGLSMILQYYGFMDDFETLRRQIVVDKNGTYIPQIGIFLMKKGFNVTIITLNPALFTLRDIGISAASMQKRFENFRRTANKQNKKVLSYFIEFLKNGGIIKVKIPDAKDIEDEIVKNRPLGASLTTAFMSESSSRFNFHFNIITGIDDKYVYVNDPLWDAHGGKKCYLKDHFFFGLFASQYGDLDNGSLLVVEKK